MHIFRDHAPAYWAAGLPVIPLKRWNSPGKGAGKAPILNEWTAYAENMPTEAMREHWLATYPDSNIGLPFGPASGLCAIDIDTDEEELVEIILGALPKSPWKRVGKKGMGLIYRWQGQPNFKLRDSDNKSIVEFLGKGNQMVLPPSIHPDTQKPYTANADLWAVLNDIPFLPVDAENKLREALGYRGVSLAHTGRSGPIDVVPQGERDIQLVRYAGYLARVVEGIDKNAKYPLVKAMEHMRTWVEEKTASMAGDDMDPEKGVAKLIEFLLRDVEGGRTLPKGWDEGLTDEQLAHPAIAAIAEKNVAQRWTVARASEWIMAKAESDPEDKNHVVGITQELIDALAADEQFSEFEFKNVINAIAFVNKRAGLSPTRPDLVQAFKASRRGDMEEAADHEAIGRQIVEQINRDGEIKWDQGKFWQWNGSCFLDLADDDIYMKIAEGVKGNNLAKRHTDYTAITKTVQKMVRGKLVAELEPGINFANGFLDTDLMLHDHSPKYGKTFTMPFEYIPARSGEAHKFMEFLEQSWGDDEDYAEKVLALQEAFASTMFGIATQYQRAFLLHGRPKTGKTQLLEILRAMMPPASQSAVPPSNWSERFQITPMIGKALNVCGELPEEGVIGGAKFKEIVEGMVQQTEFKGQDLITFKPTAAQWFASNHLPRTRDTSGGFTRRWLIFDFNHIVPDNERVVDYWKVLIAEEREAIAAWAVQGLRRLQEQREYTLPSSHFKRIDQITRANNSVAAFIQSTDKIVEEVGAKADVRNLFDHYIFYMREVSKGWHVTYERFWQMLDDLGFRVETYHDPIAQTIRHEVHGLRMKSIAPPAKD